MRGRKWRRDAHTKHRPERLRLTSMMDILTVLLLFLLKSFVVEGEVVTPVPGVELPSSSAVRCTGKAMPWLCINLGRVWILA